MNWSECMSVVRNGERGITKAGRVGLQVSE